jgi:hypothetical protein
MVQTAHQNDTYKQSLTSAAARPALPVPASLTLAAYPHKLPNRHNSFQQEELLAFIGRQLTGFYRFAITDAGSEAICIID